MKTIDVDECTLDACVGNAQKERVVLTRQGKPVAVMVGIAELDSEQLELAESGEFWELIQQRRTEPTISRQELEQRLDQLATRAARAKNNGRRETTLRRENSGIGEAEDSLSSAKP